MAVKQLSDGFDNVMGSINDLRMSLCVFIADLILAMPVGLPYKYWVFLHQIKGDWE